MISQAFDYHRPASLDEATVLLGQLGADAAVIGGGTLLVPSMTLNRTKVLAVISLAGLELDRVTLENGSVAIGAMTSYAQVLRSSVIADKLPLLRTMAEQVTGGASILNQGTLGGSAAFANPASDVPACLSALQATIELHSPRGARSVAAEDFFLGAFSTARRPDELLTCIRIPVAESAQWARYDKHKFCTSSWPIVTVACVIDRGIETVLRLSVGGAGTRPSFQRRSIGPHEWHDLDRFIDHIAAEAPFAVSEGWTDELADAAYRLAIVPAVVRRCLRSALQETSR